MRGLLPADLRGRAALGFVAAAWLGLRVAEAAGEAPVWAVSWGDDLLCLPVVLTLALAVHRLAGRPVTWRLPATHGLLAVVGYTLIFEVALPRLDVAATADSRDPLAYLVGWVFFHCLLNRSGMSARFAVATAP